MTQPLNYSLDFSTKIPPEEQARIADGMKAAYDHADPFWKAILAHCIWEAARKHKFVTVDEVVIEMDMVNVERKAKGEQLIETHNLSALGPAMQRAMKEGVISPTTECRRSVRKNAHGNLMTVWKSNFYSGTNK